MSEFAQLVVASLFAINQYIPVKNSSRTPTYGQKRIVHNVLDVEDDKLVEDVFRLAHESCRYMIKLAFDEFKEEMEIDLPLELFGGAFGIELGFSTFIDGTDKETRMRRVGADPAEIQTILKKICTEDFDELMFTSTDRGLIVGFIKEQIAVLSEEDMKSLGNFRYTGSTQIFDTGNHLLGTLRPAGRDWVDYSAIPERLIDVLRATEDVNFFNHGGISPKGLARIGDQLRREKKRIAGGSTLTMQLLKNLFFGNWPVDKGSLYANFDMKTVLRKAREVYYAKPFELMLGDGDQKKGKEKVLEYYLNLVELGPGVQGLAQAAEIYFGKTNLNELTYGESAFITALLKSPTELSNPKNFGKTSGRITDYILEELVDHKLISKTDLEEARANHLPDPSFKRPSTLSVSEALLYLRNRVGKWIDDQTDLFKGKPQAIGLQVKSTINQELQERVFKAVKSKLDDHDEKRDILSRVDAARDPSGSYALPRGEWDLNYSTLDGLGKFQDKLYKEEGLQVLAVFEGFNPDKERHEPDKKKGETIGALKVGGPKLYLVNQHDRRFSKSVKLKLESIFKKENWKVGQSFLMYLTASDSCKRDLNSEANRVWEDQQKLLEKAREQGTEFLVTGPRSFKASLLWVKENYKVTRSECLADYITPSPIEGVPEELVKNSIKRIYQGRPRENYTVALYDGYSETDQPLSFQDGSRPRLGSKSVARFGKLIENDQFKVGNFVWLKFSEKPSKSKLCTGSPSEDPWCLVPPKPPIPGPEKRAEALRKFEEEKLALEAKQQQEERERVAALEEYISKNPGSEWLRNVKIPAPKPSLEVEPDEEGVVGGEEDDLELLPVVNVDLLNVGGGEAAKGYYRLVPPPLQAAVLIMNSKTGEVLAHFGGYAPKLSEFDRSHSASRQPGSTVKPWVYLRALQRGNFESYSTLQNRGVVYRQKGEKNWSPDGSIFRDRISFEQGVILSQNQATAGLLQDFRWKGGDWKKNLEEDLCPFLQSIKLYDDKLDCVLSVVLGSNDVSIENLVKSYTYFSNGQEIVEPQYITQVSDSLGNPPLFKSERVSHEVPDANAQDLFLIRKMMIEVANVGTAKRLRRFMNTFESGGKKPFRHCFGKLGVSWKQSCIGGKTGTTNNSWDTWFVGFSSDFVMGVWVGYDYREKIPRPNTGASVAYPIFEEILRTSHDLLPAVKPILSKETVPSGLTSFSVAGQGGNYCKVRGGGGSSGKQEIYSKTRVLPAIKECNICSCQSYNDSGYTRYFLQRYFPDRETDNRVAEVFPLSAEQCEQTKDQWVKEGKCVSN